MESELERLQVWYRAQCDGDWEHTYGVEIGTLDNPGWRVHIDLAGTYLAEAAFLAVERVGPDGRWLRCWVEDQRFHAAGGPTMLPEMLRTFVDWAGLDRRQAEIIFADGGPPGELARALVTVALAGENREWVQGECSRFSFYPDANVRQVVALCLAHLARIHGALDEREAEAVLDQLARDPDAGVRSAAAEAHDEVQRNLTSRGGPPASAG